MVHRYGQSQWNLNSVASHIAEKREVKIMVEIMRRKEREIGEREIEEILKEAEYGILATVNEDKTPYAIPLNFVYMDKKIYFHCAKGVGHKLKNIQSEKQVCFTVVGKTEVLESQFSTKYESAVIFGIARETEEKREEVMKKLLEKYCLPYMQEGLAYMERALEKAAVYEIEIEYMSGKARKK